MADLKIVGLYELNKKLGNLAFGLGNFSNEFKKTADFLKDSYKSNFKSEGAMLEKWQPLTLSTLKGKIAQGFGDKQILERTGKLKNSLYSKSDNKMAEIGYRDNKAQYHQYGTKKMAQRVLVALNSKLESGILNIFRTRIQQLLKSK